jgi:hypothetical protein
VKVVGMRAHEATGRQPLLHDATVALRAPAQAWSRPGGEMTAPIDGVYVSDVRVASAWRVRVDGAASEPIATLEDAADRIRFVSLLRGLDDAGADPDVRLVVTRAVRGDGVDHELTIESRLRRELRVELTVELDAEVTPVEVVKTGRPSHGVEPELMDGGAVWGDAAVSATLRAREATIAIDGSRIRVTWGVAVPARGSASCSLALDVHDGLAVVAAAAAPTPWSRPELTGADDRLQRWVERSLGDLDALRLTRVGSRDEFLGAGAPWFFTLFGRDSIWAARFLLPLGTGIAHGTLRTLAALQGRERVPATAEQPGKIIHEVRRATLELPDEGVELPPHYYGTVDATALWICLLADTRERGLGDDETRELLPALRAALAWMRDFGDSDGDGLLEYVDESGRGLSNQGWKDSGDSVQWRDGSLAEGPIALAEVQAYAHEAAVRGAALLEEFGEDAAQWRAWAARLAAQFRASFWVSDADGRYPAIALDARKRPVDSLTSNIGHLLGTGLLDDAEARLVAARLVSPRLDAGYGIRTLATGSGGYWPLSYHGGSIWAHDTAIAIRGLHRDGFPDEARRLSEGLLRAAAAFDYRMPELHGGDAVSEVPRPVPYPAACRPQAWSAAASIVVLEALTP